ncbi:MAG: hypothetical protein HC836_24700 [Richelia sp. RM2_1_2]|nr:hypothetical protein [Richelia sp. RM1_1_1]NJO61335.1 hypothetical protein [Richelia sp. RM2_1_2]
MGQSRITLSPEVEALADDLCKVTGCSNLASLFGLMLTRYGTHLRYSWQVTNFESSKRLEQFNIPTVSHPEQSKHYVEDDPVISRIAGIIDTF